MKASIELLGDDGGTVKVEVDTEGIDGDPDFVVGLLVDKEERVVGLPEAKAIRDFLIAVLP